MNLRQAAEAACATLDYAASVADRPGLMGMCEKAAEILRAALAEAERPVSLGELEGLREQHRNSPTSLAAKQALINGLEAELSALAHPPRREPLTDETVRDLWSWASTHEAEHTATTQQHAFARAVERAHGIGTDE